MGQFIRHEAHWFINVCEEGFVSCAQVIQSRFAGWRFDEAILGATTIADEAYFAIKAVLWQRVALCSPKLLLLVTDDNFTQRNIHKIADFVRRLYEMIAGENISIMFQR